MLAINKETKLTLLYIGIAFTFSVLMRFIWIYQFSGYEAFMFNGQFMINTNDGYFFAKGAQDILNNTPQTDTFGALNQAASKLTAFIAQILPLKFETVILYLPVFLSSLIVIPIILIAKTIKNLEMGFIAALLASISWSYYNRTMVGYFDTDMLNIVIPMFFLWSIIWATQTKQNIYLLLTAIDILVYRWWYPQSYSLEFSFFSLVLLYTIVFDRKSLYNYKLLAIIMFAMLGLDGNIRLILALVAFGIFTKEEFNKYVYYILGLSVIVFLLTGGIDPIWGQLKGYVFRSNVNTNTEGLGLHFFTVMQTVREAGHIPFETFANRISGHTITFVVSLIGYAYLIFRHKIMILALPMLGLGFLASVGGLRFTIYAVPVLAFGVAYLITEFSSKLPKKIDILAMFIMTLAILYPNYKHIEAYKVPTVFNSEEVKTLNVMNNIANREDYIVGWWDYGFPLRYYANVKTLIDGGKHTGSVNFPVSFMLTNPPSVAAKMARLDIEYTEKNLKLHNKGSNIEQMTLDYGFKNTNEFLSSLYSNVKIPKKTRDIYFYLPYRMLNIYPTIALFSNMNLMTGTKRNSPFFFVSRNINNSANKIDLGNNIVINKNDNSISIGNQTVPIRRFVTTKYNEKMQLQKSIQEGNVNAQISLIYMSNYNTFLVIDESVFKSLYIQLMVLENYDKTLFKPVVLNPQVKIYKLKI